MNLTFYGAAGTVTGSCYVLERDNFRVLIDCGVFQGNKTLRKRNEEFPFDASSIDAVVLTHAHQDHIGRLPKLVKEGFNGPIYLTKTTAEISGLMLLDSANIQERETKWGGPAPLFDIHDVEKTYVMFGPHVGYGESAEIVPGWTVSFKRAGHIFGSAHVIFDVETDGGSKRIVFSGDIGRPRPIIADPDPPEGADVLIIESTYGNRDHKAQEDTEDELIQAIERSCNNNGNILIPAFSLGRTQEIIYHLNTLRESGNWPKGLNVYVDSPLSNRVTTVVRQNPQIFDEEFVSKLEDGDDPFEFPGLSYVSSVEDSKAVNKIKDHALVISASGMCTAGRILHHLKHNLDRPETSIIFVGFQAPGTRGRLIIDGVTPIRIHGKEYKNKAEIFTIGGFSGHAGRSELLEWARVVASKETQVFVTHGEPEPAKSFADLMKDDIGCNAYVPEYLESVTI